jgi:uncharacterized membrane protein YfcA
VSLTGLAFAALIGLSLGILGGGGSILTVPVFVYVLGYEPKRAIAMSLAVVGATSLFGALSHWREGNVRFRMAVTFGAVAMVGSYLGARLAVFVSGGTQLVIFGAVMLAAATSMFRSARGDESRLAVGPWPGPLLLGVAFGVGLLTGLVGVGGGFLIVPTLALIARLPMKHAVGTSLLVIALNAFTAFAGYLGQVRIDWQMTAGFTAVAIAGVLAGSAIVRFVPAAALRRGFAVFLVAMGLFILYRNRGAVPGLGGDASGSASAGVHVNIRS